MSYFGNDPAPIFVENPDRKRYIQAARAQQIDIIARTIWGEARNQGEKGMQAVANVIGNRKKNPGWWGRDFIGICLKPWQFSCWNHDDPNLLVIKKITINDPGFRLALKIASHLVDNTLEDITHGADHYVLTSFAKYTPWARYQIPRIIIGTHSFYKLGHGG